MTNEFQTIRRKQEDDEEQFLRKKRVLADKDAELYQQKTETLRSLDDLADRTRHYLQDFVEDRSGLHRAFQMIGMARDEVTTLYNKENTSIEQQLEAEEREYRKRQSAYEQALQEARSEET
ncbi:hypothetical protein HCJ66_02990 [Listeria sp. FSL L7-1582]|uniref:hypothetical protein n=1 Tax=Listeria portnoyi TaxID=2713504 RepID=UPI00164E2053|nr:hypothetical protein [Listeria portnoyi]MBC6308513.1 hypothetical protein [Listeria portnoyi]